MISRTIHEWGRINYGDGETEIPAHIADRLVAAASVSRFSGKRNEGVLEHGRTGLRARGVVGLISAPGCQLEILPKIDGEHVASTNDVSLRNRLIHMLAVTHDLPIDVGDISKLGSQSDSVLEVLIRFFCVKLMESVRRGKPRKYVGFSDDLPTVRGSLNVARQFSRLAASPQKLACHFDDLSEDIPLNQVMLAAIRKLSRLSQSSENLRLLRELSFVYADVCEVSVQDLRWDLILFDRTNRLWADLLKFARLFLLDQNQQVSGGNDRGHALLFEMNLLFEKYVARVLHKALGGTGLRVASQGGSRNCVFEGERGLFKTRPDIIIRDRDSAALIIDTKWKKLVSPEQDPKCGVSQADVYQVMAYSHLYDCPNVVLLYPHQAQLPAPGSVKNLSIKSAGAAERLSIATFDLSASRTKQCGDIKSLVSRVDPHISVGPDH